MQSNFSLPTADFSSPSSGGDQPLGAMQGGASGSGDAFSGELRIHSARLVGSDSATGKAIPDGGNALPQAMDELGEETAALKDTFDLEDLPVDLAGLLETPDTGLADTANILVPPGQLDVEYLTSFESGGDELGDVGGLNILERLQQTAQTFQELTDGGMVSDPELEGDLFGAAGQDIELIPGSSAVALGLDASGVPISPVSISVERISEQTGLQPETIRALSGRESGRLNAADIRELTLALRDVRQQAAEMPIDMRGITPAALAKVEGQVFEGRPERFRAIGLGMIPGALDAVQNLDGASRASSASTPLHAPTLSAAGTLGTSTLQGTTGTPTLTGTLQATVGSTDWSESLNDRVMMMANNKLQNAELRLTPAELGPLRIRLTMEDGAANINFTATNPTTRDAIESALPRLRNLLEESGIDLGQASVGEQSAEQSDGDADESASDSGATELADGSAADKDDARSTIPIRISRGLLDTFV